MEQRYARTTEVKSLADRVWQITQGRALRRSEGQVATLFFGHGVMQDLGSLGGDNSTAVWINDAGEVVGAADLPGSEVEHAFLWRNGVMTDLGTLGSSSRTDAINSDAINSKGQALGTSRLLDRTIPPFRHAFLWETGGPMIDLNSLIPRTQGWNW